MRKTLVLVVVIGLIAAAFTAAPAQAGKRKKKKPAKPRVVESIYDSPAIGHPDVVVGCSGSTGCATFTPGPGERYVRFEVVDQSGTTTYISPSQDLDGDGLGDTDPGNVCGKSEEAHAIEPGYAINVFISAFPGTSPACPGIGTTGKVIATFSKVPF